MHVDKIIDVPTSFSFEDEREEGILNVEIVLDMKVVYHVHISIENHIKSLYHVTFYLNPSVYYACSYRPPLFTIIFYISCVFVRFARFVR
jgi:hypothetical protein